MNLPELKGTEKQISWANDIRAGLISKTDLSHLRDDLIKPATDAWEFFITHEESASYWISLRSLRSDIRLRSILRRVGCYILE